MEELDDSLNEAELDEGAAPADEPPGGASDGGGSAGSLMEEEEEEEDVNYAAEPIPYLIYQSVALDVDMAGGAVEGHTTLWIGYQKGLADSGLSATLTLHCRHYCDVSSVRVNNISCSYRHCDPLKSLLYSNADGGKSNFTGEEADVRFRAALEVSRVGELTIQLPETAELVSSSPCPAISAPPNASRDVVKRLAKVQSIYSALGGTDGEVRLITVRIDYRCDSSSTGLSFRRPYEFSDCARINRATLHGASCLHTINGLSGGSLRDVDGVRAWLPTIDSPDQRAVFDVSLVLSKQTKYRVVCSGRFVSKMETADTTTYRFITVTRIPAMNLGFFVGKVESYSVPLYKIQGTILVATDIQDFLGYSRSTPVGVTDAAVTDAEELDVTDAEEGAPSVAKRRRVDAGTSQQPAAAAAAVASTDGEDSKMYSDAVHHTTLGLDLGIRAMHKMTNKKYDHAKYSQIFVPGLSSSCGIGCDSVSFDGFSLLDASLLHLPHQPYRETPAHFQQLSAYLYSWLKTGIPLDSYNSEYAVHGAVGYLMNVYAEQLFGEEEGRFRLQKAMDAVINLYKTGRGTNVLNFFPESYESFSPGYRLLLRHKSTLLMHTIEHRLQDREKMKRVLGAIIKSPSLYYAPVQPPSYPHSYPHSYPPPTPRSDQGMASEPSTPFYNTMEPPTPLRNPEPSTPYRDGDLEPGLRLRSRANSVDTAAAIGQALATSALLTPLHPPHCAGSMLPPTLQRAEVAADELASDNDMMSLTRDCLSTEAFCTVLRLSAGAAAVDITETFIDKFLFDSSILLLRAGVQMGEDKKDLKVVVEPVCSDEFGGADGSKLSEEVRLRIVERIDDHTSDALLSLGDRPETYTKLLYTRPQKRVFARRPKAPAAGQEEGADIRLKEAAADRAALEKEQKKRSLALARDSEHPVKLVLFDPLFFVFCDVHFTGPPSLLVEQLFSSIDGRDVHRHVNALRCLARTGATINSPPGGQGDKGSRMQLRALYDCLMGLQQRISTVSAIPKGVISRPHCMYTRAEAAMALAQWQNERAPRTTIASAYLLDILTSGDANFQPAPDKLWQGLGWLIEALKKMFMEVVRDNKRDVDILVPVAIDVSNESASYLRNAMLLALSSVRAQSGCSPSVVVMILLLFCDHYNAKPIAVALSETFAVRLSTSYKKPSVPMDSSHYKAVLLMCLSNLEVDPDPSDLSTDPDLPSPFQSDYGKLQCLDRIVTVAQNFLSTDAAVARSSARINYSDLLCSGAEASYCDRYSVPLLCSNGIVTTAALACLSAADRQLLALQARARAQIASLRGANTDDKAIETLFTTCAAVLPAGGEATFVRFAPTGLGELTGVDFVRYFLPAGAEPLRFCSRGRRDHLPRGQPRHSGTSLCPPAVRQVANPNLT